MQELTLLHTLALDDEVISKPTTRLNELARHVGADALDLREADGGHREPGDGVDELGLAEWWVGE